MEAEPQMRTCLNMADQRQMWTHLMVGSQRQRQTTHSMMASRRRRQKTHFMMAGQGQIHTMTMDNSGPEL